MKVVAQINENAKHAKITFDADGQFLYLVYGGELDAMKMVKILVTKDTLQSGDFEQTEVINDLQFDDTFDQSDFVSFPGMSSFYFLRYRQKSSFGDFDLIFRKF